MPNFPESDCGARLTLVRVGRLQERPDLRLNRPVDFNSSPRQRVQSHASAVLVAAFYGAKKYNPRLGNVLLLYLRTVNTQRQFQMLSCKAAQGKDLPNVQHGL